MLDLNQPFRRGLLAATLSLAAVTLGTSPAAMGAAASVKLNSALEQPSVDALLIVNGVFTFINTGTADATFGNILVDLQTKSGSDWTTQAAKIADATLDDAAASPSETSGSKIAHVYMSDDKKPLQNHFSGAFHETTPNLHFDLAVAFRHCGCG